MIYEASRPHSRSFGTLSAWMFVLTTAMLAVPSLAQFPQVETAVPCNDPSATVLAYGQHTTGCAISTPSDIDTFVFAATAGDPVRLAVAALTNNLDLRVRILDSMGNQVAIDSCNSGTFDTCRFEMNLTLVSGGFHTVIVSEVGANNSGNYRLQLDRVPPVAGVPILAYNVPASEILSPGTDVDFIGFNALAGDLIMITVVSLTNNLDPFIEIFDPNGMSIASGSCAGGTFNTCSFAVGSLTIASAGMHRIVVEEIGLDNAGNYEITIQCLFGPSCPLPIEGYPGSGEDLVLATGINGAAPTVFPDVRSAVANDILTATILSPFGAFSDATPALVGQFFVTGNPPSGPIGFPELHVNNSGAIVLFNGAFGGLFGMGAGIPVTGVSLQSTVPTGLSGMSLILQAVAVSSSANNGFFAAASAHEIQFP